MAKTTGAAGRLGSLAARMRQLPPIHELATICGGEGRTEGEPHDFRRIYARFVRKLSLRTSRVLLKLGATANTVTIAGIVIGLVGACLLAFNCVWSQITGLALLQLSFIIDFCDGEIARYERKIEGKSSGAGGAYLDWVGHYYLPAFITAALSWAVFEQTGYEWILLLGFVTILSLVRVPYSARDHIMWGVYRDRPELRDSEPMVRAALARMGGTPEQIDLLATGSHAMAGGEGRGLLWRRYTNLGQMIVFPGFLNLVMLAVIADLVLDWDAPQVDSADARLVLISLLGGIHTLHQLRAIWQNFRIAGLLR